MQLRFVGYVRFGQNYVLNCCYFAYDDVICGLNCALILSFM
jgi:hypothetical protein